MKISLCTEYLCELVAAPLQKNGCDAAGGAQRGVKLLS